MTLLEAIQARHSVRKYLDTALSTEQISILKEELALRNSEGNLHLQLVVNEPHAFQADRPHYGQFSGVRNYIALVGPKGGNLDERLGYHGEKVVLLAQTLGLNTCWVGLTYRKTPEFLSIREGETLRGVISIGVGANQGVQHKSKSFSDVVDCDREPDWFVSGVKAALLAPTAINQQKFKFVFRRNELSAKAGLGFFSKMDLGIAKCHFEIGAGVPVQWK